MFAKLVTEELASRKDPHFGATEAGYLVGSQGQQNV